MTILVIDGQRVNLSEDTRIEYYDRNPLFSREGQHTLDITIDLGDPQNAYVYRHLHRLDSSQRPYNRAALLYSERGVIIKGTEIVLEIDDRTAKIQIVSGNSELNYLSGGDQTIHQLDLGEIAELTPAIALATLTDPTSDYVCPPVCVKNKFTMSGTFMYLDPSEDIVYNEMTLQSAMAAYVTGTEFCPQPYLHAMVRKIVTALGYTMRNNFIATDHALSKLILINGYHSTSYANMMPDIAVDDFLTMVENFTGCVIVVDQAEKTVDILQKNFFYDNAETEEILPEDIIGEINRKYDEESPDGLLYHNVSYDFPKTETYNYWSIDKELWQTLAIEDCPDHSGDYSDPAYKEHFMNVWRHINNDTVPTVRKTPDTVKNAYNKSIVYQDKGYSDNNLVVIRAIDDEEKPTSTLLRMVNQYGPRYDERTEDEMKLKICPAEYVWFTKSNYNDVKLFVPVPFARLSDVENQESTDSKEIGLNEYINGEKEKESVEGRLYVGFYIGMKNANWKVNSQTAILFPTVIPSNTLEAQTHAVYGTTSYSGSIFSDRYFYNYPYWERVARRQYDEPLCNMQINGTNGMYERYYANALNINFTQPVKIKFRSLDLRDSRKIFVIGNQRFFCQELKHSADSNGVSEVIEGTFYQVLDENESTPPAETVKLTLKAVKNKNTITATTDKPLPVYIEFTFRGYQGANPLFVTGMGMQKGASRAQITGNLANVSRLEIIGDIRTPYDPDDETVFDTETVVVDTEPIPLTMTFLGQLGGGGLLNVTAPEPLDLPLYVTVIIETTQTVLAPVGYRIDIPAGSSQGSVGIQEDPHQATNFITEIVQDPRDDNEYILVNNIT